VSVQVVHNQVDTALAIGGGHLVHEGEKVLPLPGLPCRC
jgi:hypothetical protein